MYTVDASVWINAFDQRENGYLDSRQFLQLIKTRMIQVAAHQSLLVAANQKLRGADAIYAALALQVGSTLVTLDKEQLNRLTGIVATVTPAAAVATMLSQSENTE